MKKPRSPSPTPSSPAGDRFRAYSTRLADFRQDILVRCPRCDRCAHVTPRPLATPSAANPGWRITCLHCSHVQERDQPAQRTLPLMQRWLHDWARPTSLDQTLDPIFRLPLWLQTPCCGQVLWAYNYPHLDFLEAYITATLREQQPDDVLGWHNGSMASRLPRWMKLAKHRSTLLKAIHALRTQDCDTPR